MMQLAGHTLSMSYANRTPHVCTTPRGTVNNQDPTPPAGLTTAQAYRWTTGQRHLEAAKQIDINSLDPAGRTRHFARLRSTIDDLLHLCEELSQRRPRRPSSGLDDVL